MKRFFYIKKIGRKAYYALVDYRVCVKVGHRKKGNI